MNRLHVFAVVPVFYLMVPVRAADIVVPTQQPTIQAGINAAANGDTVLVLPGVYTGSGNRNLDFNGKHITVRRANNSGPCTIDCQGNGRAFIFDGGEGANAVVDGITMTGGFSGGTNFGAAIRCAGSSPTFRNCIIRDNHSTTDAAGVAIVPPGMAAPLFVNCLFLSNDADDDGGALWIGSPNGVAFFVNCLFSGNIAGNRGGAVFIDAGPKIHPTFVNCSFSNNSATASGGAFYRDGGGGGGGSAHLTNSILWDDAPNEMAGTVSAINTMFCIVEGGAMGFGNSGANPLFLDANGADNIAGTMDDDLRVSSSSPAIDSANNSAVPPGTSVDLAGGPRFRDNPDTPDSGQGAAPIVDRGAYEYADCPLDTTGDSNVGFAEVTELLLHWGPCPAGPCAWDSNGDGNVGFADFTAVLLGWGPCA